MFIRQLFCLACSTFDIFLTRSKEHALKQIVFKTLNVICLLRYSNFVSIGKWIMVFCFHMHFVPVLKNARKFKRKSFLFSIFFSHKWKTTNLWQHFTSLIILLHPRWDWKKSIEWRRWNRLNNKLSYSSKINFSSRCSSFSVWKKVR